MFEQTGVGEDDRAYAVVVNDEEQYSIWPSERDLPIGWAAAGFIGPKSECLAHIEEVWIDMRPRGARIGAREVAMASSAVGADFGGTLPERLAGRRYDVTIALGGDRTKEALLRRMQTGWLHVAFLLPQGQTEVRVRLTDDDAPRTAAAAFAQGYPLIRIVGVVTLDGVPLMCRIDVDGATLTAVAQLEAIGESRGRGNCERP
jgi:uncharacterized protein YbdZ (MbtH family)